MLPAKLYDARTVHAKSRECVLTSVTSMSTYSVGRCVQADAAFFGSWMHRAQHAQHELTILMHLRALICMSLYA
jgi:hypothetical protein